MLRVRVTAVSIDDPSREAVWTGVVSERQEQRVLKLCRTYQSDSDVQGELVGFRVTDGKGGGCAAGGSMLECVVRSTHDGHDVDIYFSGKLKTW